MSVTVELTHDNEITYCTGFNGVVHSPLRLGYIEVDDGTSRHIYCCICWRAYTKFLWEELDYTKRELAQANKIIGEMKWELLP